MQENYEEDLSEKEKAIVREMCNVMNSFSQSLMFQLFISCCGVNAVQYLCLFFLQPADKLAHKSTKLLSIRVYTVTIGFM